MNEMNPEIKALWITALRSGDYKQGSGALKEALKDEAYYCCLGVLCDLAEKAGVVQGVPGKEIPCDRAPMALSRLVRYDGEGGVLPNSVQEWAGLGTRTGILNPPIMQCGSLASLNDGAGFTFDEIASVIEVRF